MKRKRTEYGLLPEVAPILIAALVGLIFWLLAVDALADTPMIADYMDPCCESNYYEQERQRAADLYYQAQQDEWRRQQEMRTIRLEMEAEQQRFRDLVNQR